MKTARLLFFTFSLFIISCHKKAVVEKNPSPVAEVKKALVVENADLSATGDPYRIDSLNISNDVLSVFVNFSGGCKEHSFELISNGAYAKSLPPQLNLSLKHNGNDDQCKKLVKQELKFDVSGLRYKGNKTVVLMLGNKKVNYQGI